MISASDLKRLSIKNVNNRPNALATYGQAKMNATEAKELFDRQFELVAAKFNELCELISKLNDTFTTDAELTKGVESAKGKSGFVEIVASDWSVTDEGVTATKELADLGDNDLVLFSPSSPADKERVMENDLFILPENIGNTVTFYAAKNPTETITLFYFITRGV